VEDILALHTKVHECCTQ